MGIQPLNWIIHSILKKSRKSFSAEVGPHPRVYVTTLLYVVVPIPVYQTWALRYLEVLYDYGSRSEIIILFTYLTYFNTLQFVINIYMYGQGLLLFKPITGLPFIPQHQRLFLHNHRLPSSLGVICHTLKGIQIISRSYIHECIN